MQNKYVIKQGTSGDLVEVLQELLNIRVDGVFGPMTKKAVIKFQTSNSLVGDGVVGPMTWRKLGFNPEELFADTDITTSASWIQQYPLPDGEYVKQETPKEWIFLHHTAGRHNPYKCIDHWAKDQRGRVGTHYVIGGVPHSEDLESISKKGGEHDGLILQAIPDAYWGYHLGAVKSRTMHRNSISIEICSAGPLEERDGKFYSWFGTEIHPSQVARLETAYKGKMYYHKYSPKQIEATKALLLLLSDKHGIDLSEGVVKMIQHVNKSAYGSMNTGGTNIKWKNNVDAIKSFEYWPPASSGSVKGLLTHGQVRQGKSDVFPQIELIEMLKTLV